MTALDQQISKLHRVFVKDRELPVSSCRVSALPFNVWWLGQQRPLEQTEEASFVSFTLKNPTEIRVLAAKPFAHAVVRPLSAGIEVRTDGQEICFAVPRPGQYVLETDDEHNALHLFADAPRDFADMGKPTLAFGPGVHHVGKIVLHDGDRVYIDRDAVVYGTFLGKGVRDVCIYGHGIIDGGEEQRTSMHCYEDYTNGCIKFYESEKIRLEGVVLRDSAIWVINFFDCEDVELVNCKLVGHWRYNTDGIDIVNSRKIRIRNCFIRSFDDSITLKGIVQYKDKCVEDILVEDTVCWCGWGRTLEIGLETVAPAYRRICFRNCDLIHNSAAALDIQAGDIAEISDVRFEDIRVEYQPYTLPEVIQFPPEKQYTGYGKRGVPALLSVTNPFYLIKDEAYRWYDEELKRVREGKQGSLRGLCLERVCTLGDAGGEQPTLMVDLREPFECGPIRIRGLTVFGKKIEKAEDCKAEGNGAHLLRFE